GRRPQAAGQGRRLPWPSGYFFRQGRWGQALWGGQDASCRTAVGSGGRDPDRRGRRPRRQHQRHHQPSREQQQAARGVVPLGGLGHTAGAEHQHRHVQRQRQQGQQHAGAAHAHGQGRDHRADQAQQRRAQGQRGQQHRPQRTRQVQQFGQQRYGQQQRRRGGEPVHQGTHQHQPGQRDRPQPPLPQRGVLGIAAEQGVERQQPRQQHRHPQHARRGARQQLALAAQGQGEQHHHQHREQRRLQGVAAAAPEQAHV